jgi:hypothetical protein
MATSKKAKHASPAKPKRKIGRISRYEPGMLDIAHSACLAGATDELLAEQLGVSTTTLYEWKHAHPEFADAIKRGKHPANNRVASALYERAKGATWTEEVPIKVKEVVYVDGKKISETERVEIVEVTKRAPPDTTAGIFWMKNRRPDMWRDKQDVQHSGEVAIRQEWTFGEKKVGF